MPALYSLGQHGALEAAHAQMQPNELLVAFLDDVITIARPDRVGLAHQHLADELWAHCPVRLNSGKTRIWNLSGRVPPALGQPGAPEASCWVGAGGRPVEEQGLTVLGVPVGSAAFVRSQLLQSRARHDRLLERLPALGDLQASWLLLLFCCSPRCNYLLRMLAPATTAEYAQDHDSAVLSALSTLFFFPRAPFLHRLGLSPRKPCLRGAAGHGRHTSHLYPGGHRLCEVQLAGRQPASGEGRLTCIGKRLTQGRERTVGMAECPCPLGEGGSKGRHGCVGQECGPAGNKHSDQAGPETNRHLSRLGSREGAHKGGCLVTPPAPDLDGQDNQAAALRAEQLRVCPLFAAACKGKGGALNTTTPAAGLPRAGQGRYQRGVHGELLPGRRHDRPGDSCPPSGCCKSPSGDLPRHARDVAQLPLSLGGLGLASAVRNSVPAFWASWADCLAVLSRRLPRVAQEFLDHLDSPDPQPACFAAAAAARAALGHSDWAPPAWRELSAGESAPVVQEEGPSTFLRGWQGQAAAAKARRHRETLLAGADPAAQALLHSRFLTTVPVSSVLSYPCHLFRVLLLRRLRLPLPLAERTCRCRRLLDPFGDHRAACARSGAPGARVSAGACGRTRLQRSWSQSHLQHTPCGLEPSS